MSDPRFTLPESPELLARAEAVARERMEARDLALLPFYGGLTGLLSPWSACEPSTRRDLTAIEVYLLRDLTRPASYDAAIRWLAELLLPLAQRSGWVMCRTVGGWHMILPSSSRVTPAVPVIASETEDPREALVLALTAALEARR